MLQDTLKWKCPALTVGNATGPPLGTHPCRSAEIMEDSGSPLSGLLYVVGMLKVGAGKVAQETVRDSVH